MGARASWNTAWLRCTAARGAWRSGRRPKDLASGSSGIDFVFGSGASSDSLSITLTADASAENSFDASGDPAQAVVNLSATARFFLDAAFGGTTAGAAVGSLDLPALRAATIYERFNVVVTRDGLIEVGFQSPGDGALSITLFSDSLYDVFVTYAFEIPHGVDPTASLTIGASVVPEPATGSLLALSLIALALSRRQRS